MLSEAKQPDDPNIVREDNILPHGRYIKISTNLHLFGAERGILLVKLMKNW